MKNYKIIPQEKDNYCVCSVLQAIFDFHGISISQEAISGKLTSCEKDFKVNDDQIRNLLNDMGFDFTFYWKTETPLNEPCMFLDDMLLDPGLVGINHHIYLLYDFNYPHISIFILNK